jgi:hypothetical protein
MATVAFTDGLWPGWVKTRPDRDCDDTRDRASLGIPAIHQGLLGAIGPPESIGPCGPNR